MQNIVNIELELRVFTFSATAVFRIADFWPTAFWFIAFDPSCFSLPLLAVYQWLCVMAECH